MIRLYKRGKTKIFPTEVFLWDRLLMIDGTFGTRWYGLQWEGHLILHKHHVLGRTTLITRYRLNPVPGWSSRIKWAAVRLWYKLSDKEYLICQGCGEGIRKWVITDPNEPITSDKKWECCELCVRFYDIHLSKELMPHI